MAKIESQAEQESAVGELITLRVSSGLLGMGMDWGMLRKGSHKVVVGPWAGCHVLCVVALLYVELM